MIGIPPFPAHEKTALCLDRAVNSVGWQSIFSCFYMYPFVNRRKTMRMSYSYKPILILALLHAGDRDGCISIENAAVYFREYYSNRKAQGLAIEKKQCIYLRDDVTDAQIIANLLSNPVKALIESGFFFYNEDSHVFSVSPDIWSKIDISNKAAITRICCQKLKDYYKD